MRTNEPNMNIVNQINAALNDIRATLIELSDYGKTPDLSDQHDARRKAHYQLTLAAMMIDDHRCGTSRPWSDLKPMVDEEFS